MVDTTTSVDVQVRVYDMDTATCKLDNARWSPRTSRSKCRAPVPAKVGLLLARKPAVGQLVRQLDRPYLRARIRSNCVDCFGSTREVDLDDRILGTLFQRGRHVERILSELIVGGCNMLSTEADRGKGVETFKDKPGRVGSIIPDSISSSVLEFRDIQVWDWITGIRPVRVCNPLEMDLIRAVVAGIMSNYSSTHSTLTDHLFC